MKRRDQVCTKLMRASASLRLLTPLCGSWSGGGRTLRIGSAVQSQLCAQRASVLRCARVRDSGHGAASEEGGGAHHPVRGHPAIRAGAPGEAAQEFRLRVRVRPVSRRAVERL